MDDRAPDGLRLAGVGVWLVPPGPDERSDDAFDRVLDRASAAAVAVEDSGAGSLWVSESTAGVSAVAPYEAYSLLGALAVRTGRVHLGVVADGVERRAPSILAKVVTGVDVISHGRAILSLDADCAGGDDGERIDEALTVVRAVLEDEHPTYAGRIYTIDSAVNRPAPVQPGGIPIVVFVHGSGPDRRALLDVVARAADVVAVDGGAVGVGEAVTAAEERRRSGAAQREPVEVLGLVPPGSADVFAAVAELRLAGATGCLVGLAWPWEPSNAAGLQSAW
jgi:alkanesulfonate monooxygenase SsuD/methylene tetrahydromethanopterin reductase-like flavin-dependent oxidoreductase (luciferase family)